LPTVPERRLGLIDHRLPGLRRFFTAQNKLATHTTAQTPNVTGVHQTPRGVHQDANANHVKMTNKIVQPITNHGTR
jgi:hypothetical protein